MSTFSFWAFIVLLQDDSTTVFFFVFRQLNEKKLTILLAKCLEFFVAEYIANKAMYKALMHFMKM